MYRSNNTKDGRGEVEVYFYKTDKTINPKTTTEKRVIANKPVER